MTDIFDMFDRIFGENKAPERPSPSDALAAAVEMRRIASRDGFDKGFKFAQRHIELFLLREGELILAEKVAAMKLSKK